MENPYQPPATTSHQVGGIIRSFPVGVEEINVVFVVASFWRGLRTYSADSAGISGPVYRGACQFEVGTHERHRIVIEVDGLGRVKAHVDGKQVEENLLAGLHTVILFNVAVYVLLIVALVSTFLYLWITYEPDKWIDQWIETQM